ncbi:flagellar basal body-associated FliL family protein [Verticiella sediminum]|nr:flagellar basal body-associated FliL family protein [Verticiella sediminum]
MPTRFTNPFRVPAGRRGERPGRQQGSLGRPLLALAALAVLGASASAITYFVTTPRTATAVQAPAMAAIPLFYLLDPFTVTLTRDHSERLLHVGLTLELADEASRKRLADYMPVVRSQVLLLLGEQDADAVQTAAGKRQLAADVRTTINAIFEGRGGPTVNNVLFNAFVVQ